MTKYQITFRCQHCGEVFKNELTLPLIFEELECPECKDMTELGRLSIKEIEEINDPKDSLEQSLKEMKLMREGKLPKKTWNELKEELI